jgi:hypothetical protein
VEGYLWKGICGRVFVEGYLWKGICGRVFENPWLVECYSIILV